MQSEPAPSATGRRRRPLPFSAAGRRAPGARDDRERAVDRPPAGAPGPEPSLLNHGHAVPVEPVPAPPPEPAPTATPPDSATTPAEPAATPKRKPSFFDPEPEPAPPPTAAQRRRDRLTPTAIAALVAMVIALAVLAYVIVNTGNSTPPPQASLGAFPAGGRLIV